MQSWTLRYALFLAIAAASPAPWALPAQYHVTDLGDHTFVAHLNKEGVVAGTYVNHNVGNPVLWKDGELQFLQMLQGSAQASWVNASGVTSGNATVSGNTQHAVVWAADGTVTDLAEIIGLDWSSAPAINDNGDCVVWGDGLRLLPGCTGREVIVIDDESWQATWVAGINSNGDVAGTAVFFDHTGDASAFLYSKGTTKDLGVLPNFNRSYGLGLNGKGHVVGYCETKHRSVSFFWNGKAMERLKNEFGGSYSRAYAINYFDVIVGVAEDESWASHPYILDKGTKRSRMLDLSKMLDSSGAGWAITKPININSAGQILVEGTLAGQRRHAILTPVD